MRARCWLIRAVIPVVVAACGGSDGTTGPGNPPSLSGTIAFISERDGTPEIYTLTASTEKRLTTNTIPERNLLWSRDGNRIFFTERTSGAGPWGIWAVNADGTSLARVTTPLGPELDDFPQLSPDGLRLVYTRFNPQGQINTVETRVVNTDGTGDALVVHNGFLATWLGNAKLALNGYANGHSDIYTVGPDGTGLANVTNTASEDEDFPATSPDGSKIAFDSYPGGIRQIFEMNTDGSGRSHLSSTGAVEDAQVWSPDSRQIAFRSSRDYSSTDLRDVYVMNADGSGQRRLSQLGSLAYGIAWSPDGRQLAFTIFQGTLSHIYLVNAAGGGASQLTASATSDAVPVWKP